MNDDFTITSPHPSYADKTAALLCLTVVWHPDAQLVSKQFLASNNMVEISRYSPLFQSPGQQGLPLGSQCISRSPLTIIRKDNDDLEIFPSDGRMVCELNGMELTSVHHFSSVDVERGLMLFLGHAVLISLNWIYALPKDNPVYGLIGVSSAAQKTRDLIRQVAKMNDPVLLLGETGTGKEVAAKAIHMLSHSRDKPLVCVNMAALNESLAAADLFGAVKGAYTGAQANRQGFFAAAENATLFLDEIGNTPLVVQPMLLRVLETGDYRPLGGMQDKQSSVRLITATDQNLHNGNFNQALLRRLESLVIHIPPLRARREDIGLLLLHLIDKHLQGGGSPITLDAGLVNQFCNYHWPGNIRELLQVFKRILLQLQLGEPMEFTRLVQGAVSNIYSQVPVVEAKKNVLPEKQILARKRLADLTEDDVIKAMEENFWYIQGAAQSLGISRPSMYQLLKIHSVIRKPNSIANGEIQQAVVECKGNIEAVASRLKTPTEALRRFLRQMS